MKFQVILCYLQDSLNDLNKKLNTQKSEIKDNFTTMREMNQAFNGLKYLVLI